MTFFLFLWQWVAEYFAGLQDRRDGIEGPQDGADVDDLPEIITAPAGVMLPDSTGAEFDGDLPGLTPLPVIPTHRGRFVWCINRAHGKFQGGKRSPVLPELGRRFFEWEWSDRVVDLVIEGLENLGVRYFEVVPEANVGRFLAARVDRANNLVTELPKMYLSIHANTAHTPDLDTWEPNVTGTETWCYHTSLRGRKMAGIFQRHLLKATGLRDRGVKSQESGQFYELSETTMPSVLTEAGFYNSPEECRYLMRPEVMQAIADAHIEAILEIEEHGL
jgi:hypothetical protein